MHFTYNKYAIPYPYLDEPKALSESARPQTIFLPDQIIEALEKVVLPLAKEQRHSYQTNTAEAAFFIQDEKTGQNRILIRHPSVSWGESCSMARETAKLIDPILTKNVDAAINNWTEARIVKPGFSGGTCDPIQHDVFLSGKPPALIKFSYDNTICDPVYLTHEIGHFTACDQSEGSHDKEGRTQTDGIRAEVQAFFFQHAFYDQLMNPQRSVELADAVALQQNAETMNVLNKIEYDFTALEKSRLVRGTDRLSAEGYAQLNSGYWLHSHIHSAPYFLAAGLWNQFKAMPSERRTGFLSVLYPDAAYASGTKKTSTLEEVFSAMDVNTQTELNVFMKESATTVLSALPCAPQLPVRSRKFQHIVPARA